MSILFVIHETGRSMSLMAIARQLLAQNPQEKIIFLAVGHAANDLLMQMTDFDPLRRAELKSYANFFSDKEIKHLEDHPLNSTQLDTIKKYLSSISIDKVIIGSPSWLNALAPFQIAEAIADSVIPPAIGFIYDGDFYKEAGCAYWSTLEKPDTNEFAWRRKFTWLASLSGSKDLVPEFKPPLSIEVVGDPAIDTAINAKPLSTEDRAIIREGLAVREGQELLIVAASKYIDADKDLVTKLLNQNPDASFQIRILLHRGTKDYNEHIATYLDIFKKYPSAKIKIVAIPFIKNRISNEYLSNSSLIVLDHSIEKIAAAADRLCSTIPGTQATQAAINGIPVYCHLTQHVSYLPEGRINVGEQGLSAFLTKTRIKLPSLTKADMGLSNVAAVDVVSAIISSKKSLSIYGAAPDPTLFASLKTEYKSPTGSSEATPGFKPN
jgi:hypothetical protein